MRPDPGQTTQPRANRAALGRPHSQPIIDAPYLSDSGGIDRAAMMEGLRVCAKIADAPPLKELLGVDVASARRDRDLRGDPRIGAQ